MNINPKKINDLIYGKGVDSHNRFPFFMKNSETLNDAEYWYGLGKAYSDSDNSYKWRSLVKAAFSAKRLQKQYLMTTEEIKGLKKLGKTVTIYRGMTVKERRSGKFGVSWTLDKRVAQFFADKYPRNYSTHHEPKIVHSLNVNRRDILALLNDRQEQEVIYLRRPFKTAYLMISKHIKTYIKEADYYYASFY